MRKELQRRHDAHLRVNNVCAEHRELFDGTPGEQKARAALGTHVADIDRLQAMQERLIEDGLYRDRPVPLVPTHPSRRRQGHRHGWTNREPR